MKLHQKFLLLSVSLLLSACASQPLSEGKKEALHAVAVFVNFDGEAVAKATGISLVTSERAQFSVENWNLGAYFQKSLLAALKEKSIPAVSLTVAEKNPSEELYLAVAKKQKADLLLVVKSNTETIENYPAHELSLGVLCYDSPLRKSKVSPYFKFSYELVDMNANHKVLFRDSVTPEQTESMSFLECSILKDKILQKSWKEFRGPMEQTLDLLVPAMLHKIGF